MNLPPTIAADAAMTRQNVAMSMIKRSADQDKAIAGILEKAVDSIPKDSIRGTNLNVLA